MRSTRLQSQAGASFFATSRLRQRTAAECQKVGLRNPVQHRNSRLAKHVLNLGFAQARCIVLKTQYAACIIHMEAAQAVCVGKIGECPKLIVCKWGLQAKLNLNECHGI